MVLLVANQNHHYVPKFLLKKFAFKAKTCNVFDLNKGQWLDPVHVNNLASKLNFYSIDTVPEDQKQIIENTIQKVEVKAAPICKKIQKGKTLTIEEECNLALFLALMYLRTPKSLNKVELILKTSIQHRIDLHLNNMRRNINDVSKIPTELKPLMQEKLYVEKILPNESSKDFQISIKPWGKLQFLFSDVMPEIASMFLKSMQWSFYINKTPISFIITDNPVTIYNPDHQLFPYSGHGLYSSLKSETYFPISPYMCLCITRGKRNLKYLEIDSLSRVSEINKRIIENADQLVISKEVFDINIKDFNFRKPMLMENLSEKHSSFMIYE